MKERQNVVAVRSSSCRDVSFEVRSAISSYPHRSNSVHGFEVIGDHFGRTESRLSSRHFCDINVDGDEEEGCVEEEIYPDASTAAAATTTTGSGSGSKRERLSIILHQSGFTVYKRLFLVSLALNITAIVLAVSGKFSYARSNAAVFAVGNILGLVLCRSEAFLRCVFWLAVKVLGRCWVPLFLKTAATSFLQSIGGIHSGCGLSSIGWLTYALVQTERTPINIPINIPIVGWIILCLLILSSFSANPIVRHLYHNAFENIHRFAGWAALGLMWILVVLTEGDNPTILVRREIFWLTLAITFLIILPWTTVRKVPVEVTSPSPHASIIKFPGGLIPGVFGRIARSPLSDWHTFGTISDGKDTHRMLVGAVGDFTRNLISNPPTHLWVRQTRFSGLTYLLNMYKRVVVVATGSGICVYLSFFLQPSAADVHLVWVTKAVEKNVGGEIKAMLDSFPKEKVVVHDTDLLGRPDLATITVEAARRWMADVVVVTSNPKGTAEVVGASKAAGFNAFGSIWDS